MSGLTYFVSGASAPADIRGLARVSVPFGISLPELSAPALDVLCSFAFMPLLRVFVDSGAFSEVDRTGKVVHPITDAAWVERVRVMHRIAATFGPAAPAGDHGPRVWVVSPDRVGDQAETLRRMAMHADALRGMRALGARVIVPIQRGSLRAADFDAACTDALGFKDYVRGIPGNKAAMPEDELATFLRARRPRAVHLLGIGPRSASYRPLRDVMDRMIPEAEVSCDSNALAANVGHTNGRGGGPRRLTAWQEHFSGRASGVCEPPAPPVENARELAAVMAFGPQSLFARFVEEHGHLIGLKPEVPALQRGLFDGVADVEGL